jgi:chorismate dehydratase
MTRVRLGSVGYLNARPLVYGLDRVPRFDLRFDVPARCADLLHGRGIDVGLIPSIEYLRAPAETGRSVRMYSIVPDLAITSRGPVASVALFATRSMSDVRSIAMDTSSRTSVALVRVLCSRVFNISPSFESRGPDIADMLAHADAALIIGDPALLLNPCEARLDPGKVRLEADTTYKGLEKVDLGQVWTEHTGLPFVYAFWAGVPGVLTEDDVRDLQDARDRGIEHPEDIAREYFQDPAERAIGARYLRDNIKYSLGPEECAGLDRFYRYAVEAGVVERTCELQFYR